MLERLFILCFATIAMIGVWQLWRYYQAKQLTRLAQVAVPAALSNRLAPGPTVLYFTGPHCTQCRLQQSPILNQLVNTVKINLQTVDAVQEGEVASFYGVMTVPTTILLDSTHAPKAINHGLASLHQLRQQVAELLQ